MEPKRLGANIRKYRTGMGLTQEEAADRCGLSVNYFRQIELGNKTPQLKTFIRIAETLSASADDLLDGILETGGTAQVDELVKQIRELPANKRALVLSQIETLLASLKSI